MICRHGRGHGSLHLDNTTLAFNTASSHGGGVYLHYAYYVTDLQSTIVAGNEAAGGAEDFWPPGMTVTGASDLIVAAPTGVTLPLDTLTADPQLQPLANNGGRTMTHALGEGSPAIDAGGNPAGLDFDQRGAGFARLAGVAPDIGAYEAQVNGPPGAIFSNGFENAN